MTRKTCLATGPMIDGTGASWNASLPIALARHLAADHDHGNRIGHQSRIGVTVLVAPGPEVTMATPTRPLARA